MENIWGYGRHRAEVPSVEEVNNNGRVYSPFFWPGLESVAVCVYVFYW